MKLDKRKKTTKIINRWFNKYTASAAMWGFLIGSLVSMYFSLEAKRPLLNPRGGSLVNQVAVNAVEVQKPFCKDPISCIRDMGEKQGRSNKTIMTMIRIAQKESMCNTKWKNSETCVPNNGVSGIGVDPNAKNPKSSARGLFQIIAGTWYSNDCVGDKYNYQDNITCAYKILDGQGLRAWEVCNTGSAKCY